MLTIYNIQTHKHKTLTSYMTSNEKIDHFDNQLILRKANLPNIYQKYVSGVFCNITSKLLKVKFRLI